jgi:hypothetical protein
MAELKTQGTEIYILDATNSGSEVQKIGKVTGGSGVGGEAGEIDITNLDSTAMEFLTGLKDNGSVSLDVNWDPQDGSHQDIDNLVGGDNVRVLICGSEGDTDPSYGSDFTIPTDRTTLDFTAGFRSFQKDFGTDDVWRGSITMRVSGAITITPAS